MNSDSSYDELPQLLNGTLDYPVTPPPDLAVRTIASGRRARRRGRVLVGMGSVTAVAVVAVAVPVAHLQTRSVTRPDSVNALSAPPAGTVASTSISPSVGAAPTTPFPPHFLADIGAGAERETVVDTATGATGRVLTSGSQLIGVVSNDGKTLWEPVGATTRWDAIAIATGVTKRAPQFDGDRDFAISPSDGTSATWDGSTLRIGAASRPASSAPYPAWAGDGRHLVITTPTGVDVLDRTLHVTLSLTAPHGCVYDSPHFRGDQTLAVGKTCSRAGTSAIVFDDSASGRQLGSAVIAKGAAPGSLFGISSMDVDTAGNVIAVLNGADGVVYTVSARNNAVHAQGTVDTYEVSWLPRSD